MKKILLAFFTLMNLTQAATWTAQKEIKLDFSKTDIVAENVSIEFFVRCSYDKKYYDIISGRWSRYPVSCGEDKRTLKIINGSVTLPAVEKYNHRKGGSLENYTVYVTMSYMDKKLLELLGYNEKLITFYQDEMNISFKQFELKGTELLYEGQNVINSPVFEGVKTDVAIYFYTLKNKYMWDTQFSTWFKVSGQFEFLKNKGQATEDGVLKINKTYLPVVNGEEEDFTVEAWARTKDRDGWKIFKTKVKPLQSELDQLSKIELQ